MNTLTLTRPMTGLSHSMALPYIGMFIGMLSLAVGTSYAKTLFPLIGAEGTSACRVGLSSLILLMIWRPWRMRLSKRDLRNVLLYGAALGTMNLLFYMSLRTIPVGIAIAIEFSGPLTIALLHSRRLIHFVWIALAVLGLGLLLPLGGHNQNLDLTGIAFAAAAGVCWALYIVFGKRLSHIPAGPSVAMGMTVAAMIILPFGIAEAGTKLLDPSILLAGLVVAIFSSALPYTLDMVALKRIPERTFGVITSAEPAVGAIAGMLILHEYLNNMQWFAILAIVVAAGGAIATATRSDAKMHAKALPVG